MSMSCECVGTCEYVALHVKGILYLGLRTLRWGIIPNYQGGPNLIPWVLKSRKPFCGQWEMCLQKNGHRDATLLALKMEDGAIS